MAIRFRCPDCDATLSIASRKAGVLTDCPKCMAQVKVPGESQVDKAAPSSSDLSSDSIETEWTSSSELSQEEHSPTFWEGPSPRRRSKTMPLFLIAFFGMIAIIALGVIVYKSTRNEEPKASENEPAKQRRRAARSSRRKILQKCRDAPFP